MKLLRQSASLDPNLTLSTVRQMAEKPAVSDLSGLVDEESTEC